MKDWLNRAAALLTASLEPPRHELNELDWKAALSSDKKRLSEHLSAFANYPGGGFLTYGIDNTGALVGIAEAETVINQLANLGRDAVEPQVALDHAIETIGNSRILFVHIPESTVKPVHLRGKDLEHAFIRSGGTTRPASRQEVGHMMMNSRTPRWEELRASTLLSEDAALNALEIDPIFNMLERPISTEPAARFQWLIDEHFVERAEGGGFITNLGAMAAASDLNRFPDLARKMLRVIVYDGQNKALTKLEREGKRGYAVSFQDLLRFVMSLLPQSEVIERALRVTKTVYPEIALRELIANALIHQDFSITGTAPLIEVFSDRIEISNPGGLLPSKRLDRLIGTQPESRNEQLARAFRRYKICEERGSGLLKAGLAVEIYGLPPIRFEAGQNFFKVTLFTPRTFSQMSPRERLEGCYQHAVLQHFSGSALTNTSLRQRLKMPERQRSMVSVLIQEALDQNLIKPSDPENRSKKFAEYIPAWA